MIKDEGKGKSFGFERSTSWNKTDVFGLFSIGKEMKVDKKLIRFAIPRLILSSILMSSIPSRHFD